MTIKEYEILESATEVTLELSNLLDNEISRCKALAKQKEEMLTEIQMLLFAEEPHRISEKLFLLWDKHRKLNG